ncbi:hypothetical protein [Kamptonema formosum]|uniref:hypothetical protein n=1 Tax=Kamptonema formosum TaxID=331992 RepID=UPI000346AEF9
MNPRHKLIVVLLAEDDPDDRLLAKEVLEESGLVPLLACVEDGEELMDYLYRRSKYAPAGSIAATAADPAGCEYAEKRRARGALGDQGRSGAAPDSNCDADDIKSTGTHRSSYDAGANFYITKPVTFEYLVSHKC